MPRCCSGSRCSLSPATSACGPIAVVAGLLIALFVAVAARCSRSIVFSYIAYARLGVEHGLESLRVPARGDPADEAAARVDDFRDAVSVYGPLFTLAAIRSARSASPRRSGR